MPPKTVEQALLNIGFQEVEDHGHFSIYANSEGVRILVSNPLGVGPEIQRKIQVRDVLKQIANAGRFLSTFEKLISQIKDLLD